MNEIICPHCHKAFKVDEAGYADILKQVHISLKKNYRIDYTLQNEKRKCNELLRRQILQKTVTR